MIEANEPTSDSTGMNLASVWETIAGLVPERPALVHGDAVTTWRDFESRASRLATHLSECGVGPGDNVALYLYNCSEYLEATFAAFKVRAATVNVNYRYLEGELEYLFDNSDAKAVIFHAEFADRLGALRSRLPQVKAWICVGDGGEVGRRSTPAEDFDEIINGSEPMAPIERSGEDRWILYTGGTTGHPKGVIWPHRSLLQTAAATFAIVKSAVPETVDDVGSAIRSFAERDKFVTLLPAAPLMHGTSAITALGVLSAGGTVLTLTARSFDAHELWRAVQDWKVTQLTIVGDAFAKPMLDALTEAAERGDPYEVSSLKIVLSSGVMWSRESKEALHRWTKATLADSLGSSEGVGFATSVSRPGSATDTARFSLGPNAAVFTAEGRRVEPGSDDRGLLAVSGAIPVGYYNDPAKTAETFRTFEGRIWSVPGDFATVESDGTIRLLGRGSACINTAGEKVYPEEVEEVLKLHPLVHDANVVGMPDERWGSAVHAVVSTRGGEADQLEPALIEHCKQHLAGYKCPKRVHLVTQIQRGPNGKPDYKWASTVAATG